MKEVIRGAVETLRDGRPCVLATVVRTKGSTPQKAGAMLLVRDDGSGLGTLGGGCVEGDIWFAAQEMLRQAGGPEFKDYYLNEDIAARDGLVCGGTMYFYLEPLRRIDDFLPLGDEILEAYDGGEPVSLATVVNSPRRPELLGAKLLLRADGTVSGTLGAPALDEPALATARRIADIGNTESITADGAEIFVEGFTTPPTLVMVGGGHVGKATADLANLLGYRVYVVDDRPEFANKERFPYAEQVVVAPYHQWAEHLSINVNSFLVVATRGHRFDDIGIGVGAENPRPVHRAIGQPPQDADDLPPLDGAGRRQRAHPRGLRPRRPEHRRPYPGGAGGKHNVGNHHGAARRRRRANADGRLVHRPRRQHRGPRRRGLADAGRLRHPAGRRGIQQDGTTESAATLGAAAPCCSTRPPRCWTAAPTAWWRFWAIAPTSCGLCWKAGRGFPGR